MGVMDISTTPFRSHPDTLGFGRLLALLALHLADCFAVVFGYLLGQEQAVKQSNGDFRVIETLPGAVLYGDAQLVYHIVAQDMVS